MEYLINFIYILGFGNSLLKVRIIKTSTHTFQKNLMFSNPTLIQSLKKLVFKYNRDQKWMMPLNKLLTTILNRTINKY